MNTKLTTSRMRTGQWADIIEDSGRFYTVCPVMETGNSAMIETAIPEIDYSGDWEPLNPILRATNYEWRSHADSTVIPMFRAISYNKFTAILNLSLLVLFYMF